MLFGTLLGVLLTTMVDDASIDRWSGIVQDEQLKMLAPESQVILESKTFESIWKAWNPDEASPKLDFEKDLVIVVTSIGPNLLIVNPKLSDEGDLSFVAASTRRGGPGFGYLFLRISRDGIRSVNGVSLDDLKDSSEKAEQQEESIDVTIVGTIQTGLMAIGGETTGTTISAKGVTWELELSNNQTWIELLSVTEGKKFRVRGSLELREGIEIPTRWVVIVSKLEKLGD